MSTHTLSVLVENKPGVLARVAGLFAARGYNIHSLAVGTTEEPGFSRMTIVVDVKTKSLEQVVKQLNKLVNVIKILELPEGESIERELALMKVRAQGNDRARIIEIVDIFRARISGVTNDTITVEATGGADKLRALTELLTEYGIVEMARTGTVALTRDDRGMRERVLRAAPED